MTLSLEYLDIQGLQAYSRNARTHSDEQIEQLVNSIQEFGFTNPVLVDENGVLIAGHGRTAAATELGMQQVPAIRLVGLSEDQKKALRIADNQLALNAGWDLDLLAEEVVELREADFDLPVLGFDEKFLSTLLGQGENEEYSDSQGETVEKSMFKTKTFVLHEDQASMVDDALMLARANPIADTGINENSNANALALICKQWLDLQDGKR